MPFKCKFFLASRPQTLRFVTFEPQLFLSYLNLLHKEDFEECHSDHNSIRFSRYLLWLATNFYARRVECTLHFFVFCVVDSLYMLCFLWRQRLDWQLRIIVAQVIACKMVLECWGWIRPKPPSLAVITCPRRNVVSKVFNTSCQTEKNLI